MKNLGTRYETEKVIELYKQGLNNKEIAIKLGRSENFVRTRILYYFKTGELYLPKEKEEKDTQKIIDMYKDGYKIKTIMAQTGRGYTFIHKRILDYKDSLNLEKLEGKEMNRNSEELLNILKWEKQFYEGTINDLEKKNEELINKVNSLKKNTNIDIHTQEKELKEELYNMRMKFYRLQDENELLKRQLQELKNEGGK